MVQNSRQSSPESEPLRDCSPNCGGPCNAKLRFNCVPKCGSFCLNNQASSQVPPPVAKTWDDLYDKVMKESGDVGCQPYFAPPNPMIAARITARQYKKQTIYQDNVRNALKRQIRARKEEDEDSKEEDDYLEVGPAPKQADIDLMRILNAPPIDVAYRNYMARTRESLEEEERRSLAVNIPVAIQEEKPKKKALLDPAEKKKDFVLLAKMVTIFDEEVARNVEELWAALGPMMIELDMKEKRKALKKVSQALKESKAIQQGERTRMVQENQAELEDFLDAKSNELDKKYDRVLTLIKTSMEKSRVYAVETLLRNYEELNNYEIEWAKTESAEKFQESVRVFTQYCNLWMRIMQSIDAKTQLNARELKEKDFELILSVQRMEEQRILKSLSQLNKDHELIEGTLGDYLYSRDKTINHLLVQIDELHKKVDVWKNLAADLMKQFQKFVTRCLGEQPVLTQYLLSVDAMYKHFLEDTLQEEQAKKTKEANKDMEALLRKRCPAIALPQRLSQGSTPVTSRSATSKTEPENIKSQIPDALMAGIVNGALPEYIDSYDELSYLQDQEIEAVVQTFGFEDTDDEDLSNNKKSTRSSSQTGDVAHDEEVRDFWDEECQNMAESTRNKIDTVLKLMHENRDFMKGFLNL